MAHAAPVSGAVADPYFGDHSVQPVRTPIWNELMAPFEWAILHASPVYYGYGVPHGNGEAVVVVPGFFGNDMTLLELYWWLARIGYQPYYSGLGFNADCPDISAASLLGVVLRAADETGEPVRLIGHSLGALIARSVALDHPELVDTLISLAAPFNDVAYVHPALIEAMEAVRRQAGTHLTRNVRPTCYSGHCSCNFTKNIMRPGEPRFSRFALYAELDGLVEPESCMEAEPELNHGIATTHYGMIANAEAYRVVAERLGASIVDQGAER